MEGQEIKGTIDENVSEEHEKSETEDDDVEMEEEEELETEGNEVKKKRSNILKRRYYCYPYIMYKFRNPLFANPSVYRRHPYEAMGIATLIKDYGTDILDCIRGNDLPLFRSIVEKHLRSSAKIAKLCVTDIKHRPTKKFACPLILASRLEDPRLLKYMLDKGTDPNFIHNTIFSSKRRETITALHVAVDLAYYDTVEVLMNANADPNIPDHNQETPLLIAIKKADRIMVRMLLNKGADPSIRDKRGNAALHISTLYGHLQIVKTLLKSQADAYQKGQYGLIPSHIAAREGHIHLVQVFCSRDIGNTNIKIPCCQDQREKAPIHLAAEQGHVETLVSLVDQFQADVNLKDSDGNTPLHCVVLSPYDPYRMREKDYYYATAKVLVKYNVSINEKNDFGDSALHFAAMNHFQKIVELLLSVGANPFLENDEGLKPIDITPDSDPVTKQMLKSAMHKPKPPIHASQLSLQRDLDISFNLGNVNHMPTLPEGPHMNSGFPNASHSSVFGGSQMQMNSRSMRSTSSMSSVFVDDVRAQKERDKREQILKERDRAARDKEREQAQRERELAKREARLRERERSFKESLSRSRERLENKSNDVERRKENSFPLYTKVNKKGRKRSDQQSVSTQDDDYFEETESYISTNTESSVPQEYVKMRRPPANRGHQHGPPTNGPERDNRYQQQNVRNQSTEKRGKGLPIQPDYTQKKISDDEETTSSSDESEGQTSEEETSEEETSEESEEAEHVYDTGKTHIYENLPPPREKKTKEQAKKNLEGPVSGGKDSQGKRKAGKLHSASQQSLSSHTEEGGIQVHSIPGKPGTIEVQYTGGPITISVDTQQDDYNVKEYDQKQIPPEDDQPPPLPERQRKEQIDDGNVYVNQEDFLRAIKDQKDKRMQELRQQTQREDKVTPNKYTTTDEGSQTMDFSQNEISGIINSTMFMDTSEMDVEQSTLSVGTQSEMVKTSIRDAVVQATEYTRDSSTQVMDFTPTVEKQDQSVGTPVTPARMRPKKPLSVTRSADATSESRHENGSTADRSSATSPQYKSFSQKLALFQQQDNDPKNIHVSTPQQQKPKPKQRKSLTSSKDTTLSLATEPSDTYQDYPEQHFESSSSESSEESDSDADEGVYIASDRTVHIEAVVNAYEQESRSSSSSSHTDQESVIIRPHAMRATTAREIKVEPATEVVQVTSVSSDAFRQSQSDMVTEELPSNRRSEHLEIYVVEPGRRQLQLGSRLSGEIESPPSNYSTGGVISAQATEEEPQTHKRTPQKAAGRDFATADIVMIETSSDTSDEEEEDVEESSLKEGKRVKPDVVESLLLAVPPVATNKGRLSPASGSDSSESSSRKKFIGQYTKPYQSFGKIETNTDLLEQETLVPSVTQEDISESSGKNIPGNADKTKPSNLASSEDDLLEDDDDSFDDSMELIEYGEGDIAQPTNVDMMHAEEAKGSKRIKPPRPKLRPGTPEKVRKQRNLSLERQIQARKQEQLSDKKRKNNPPQSGLVQEQEKLRKMKMDLDQSEISKEMQSSGEFEEQVPTMHEDKQRGEIVKSENERKAKIQEGKDRLRQIQEEHERQLKLQEEVERQREQAEEEKMRKLKEEEELRLKREQEKRRKHEEELERKRKLEQEKQIKLQEEQERLRKLEEERQKKIQEEQERLRIIEEEKQKKIQEELELQIIFEEEQKRLKQIQEEEMQKRIQEEKVRARKLQEERDREQKRLQEQRKIQEELENQQQIIEEEERLKRLEEQENMIREEIERHAKLMEEQEMLNRTGDGLENIVDSTGKNKKGKKEKKKKKKKRTESVDDDLGGVIPLPGNVDLNQSVTSANTDDISMQSLQELEGFIPAPGDDRISLNSLDDKSSPNSLDQEVLMNDDDFGTENVLRKSKRAKKKRGKGPSGAIPIMTPEEHNQVAIDPCTIPQEQTVTYSAAGSRVSGGPAPPLPDTAPPSSPSPRPVSLLQDLEMSQQMDNESSLPLPPPPPVPIDDELSEARDSFPPVPDQTQIHELSMEGGMNGDLDVSVPHTGDTNSSIGGKKVKKKKAKKKDLDESYCASEDDTSSKKGKKKKKKKGKVSGLPDTASEESRTVQNTEEMQIREQEDTTILTSGSESDVHDTEGIQYTVMGAPSGSRLERHETVRRSGRHSGPPQKEDKKAPASNEEGEDLSERIMPKRSHHVIKETDIDADINSEDYHSSQQYLPEPHEIVNEDKLPHGHQVSQDDAVTKPMDEMECPTVSGNVQSLPIDNDKSKQRPGEHGHFVRNMTGRRSHPKMKGRRSLSSSSSRPQEAPPDPPMNVPQTNTTFQDAAFASITQSLQNKKNPQESRRDNSAQNQNDPSRGNPPAHGADTSFGDSLINDSQIRSDMWKDRKEQEKEMERLLLSMSASSQASADPDQVSISESITSSVTEDMDLLPHHELLAQKVQKPPPPNKPAHLRSQSKEPNDPSQEQVPSVYRPKPPPITTRKPPYTYPGQQSSKQVVSELWSQQMGKAEVVDVNNTTSGVGKPEAADESTPFDRRPAMPRGRKKRTQPGAPVHGGQSDSEALVKGQNKSHKKSITFSEIHSEAETADYEPPKPVPGKSLHEAAMDVITSGLQQQPKMQPQQAVDRSVNYTRGVYRPRPVKWNRPRGGSDTGGQYGDSQLPSSQWRDRDDGGQSDGEADVEDEQNTSLMESPGMTTGVPKKQPRPYIPAKEHQRPPVDPRAQVQMRENTPRRGRRKKKRDKPPKTEPDPVDFNQYGLTAKLWMEQVDQKTVQKSKTMYLSLLTEENVIPEELKKNLPKENEDDVFLPSQWVMARGRSIRRRKRKMEKQRRFDSMSEGATTSGGESDFDRRSTASSVTAGSQLLLFFKVGGNWQDLAWVLFDKIHTDAETLRMIKDIQLKHKGKLTEQVQDLMHRWWRKKGSEATIEELQKALDVVHLVYIHEEIPDSHYTSFALTDTEDELDISHISDADPDVSRLITEYKVRSLNASFDVSQLPSSAGPDGNPEFNTDVLIQRLEQQALSKSRSLSASLPVASDSTTKINRSLMDRSRESLGRKSSGSRMDYSSDNISIGYDSDLDQRSFVIVQPQLKSSDFRHETTL